MFDRSEAAVVRIRLAGCCCRRSIDRHRPSSGSRATSPRVEAVKNLSHAIKSLKPSGSHAWSAWPRRVEDHVGCAAKAPWSQLFGSNNARPHLFFTSTACVLESSPQQPSWDYSAPCAYPMSAGFVFVNFNNPEEAEHGDFKKKVRSQAATHSHRVAPRRGVKFARYEPRPTKVTNAAVSPDSTSSTSDASRSTVLPSPDGEAPNSAIAKLVKTDVRPSEPTRHPSPSPALRTGQQSVPGSLGLSIQTSPRSALRRLHAANKTTNQANIGLKRSRSRSSYEQPNKRSAHHNSGDLAALIPYGKLPDPSYLDSGPRDPFDTYPVPYQPWFGWLLDFWYSGTLPKSNRLVKTTPERMNTYITWSRRFELTEPALFYTSLFLASGIPVANGSMGVEKALWLRGQAVRALNEALDDPERAISNAVISAVGKIALHEHIYGDRQAAHRIHRPAQQRYASEQDFDIMSVR